MSDDERQIRALIERWAKAVHAADMDGVLVDHADDIVMFDVPPPNEVRGKQAYRETWPPFFKMSKKRVPRSRSSRSTSRQDTTLRSRALLRCGTEQELGNPGNRLRLTIGLRKQGGRWTVAHEHHSFPLPPSQ